MAESPQREERHAPRGGQAPAGNDVPAFAIGAGRPPAESGARRRVIHLTTVVALAVTVLYLTWRVRDTLGPNLWLAIPLWLLEVHAFVGLGLFAYSLWDVDAEGPRHSDKPHRRVGAAGHTVAVLITTYDEPREILLPTIAAAVALEPAHQTWVLDDGGRPWVAELAGSLGARYLAREDRRHAKAGNLNHALDHLDVELVAILDADHVATPDFLARTLGYFDDPRVAVVQTPQDFYNVDSFEHDRNRSMFWRSRRAIPFNEQRLFYRAIQPGKNRWGAAFWCGTNAVVRVAALRDVGGVATETVTEDIHTTIRMHRRGWRSVYHNEVLARGLAARDVDQYQSQRLRWGTGAMQLLHTEHPLTGPGLTARQRLAYAATILGWFDAWRSLGYVLLPVAVILTGASPIRASATTFALAFGATFVVQRVAMALLSRGYAPLGMATVFEFVRMQATITATLRYLRPGERTFTVTSKSGDAVRHRRRVPWLLWGLLGLSILAAGFFVLTVVGATPLHYGTPWTADGALAWLVVNGVVLTGAIARTRSERFAGDRRTATRLRVTGGVTVDDTPADLVDVSVGGALVRWAAPDEASVHTLEFGFDDGETIRVKALERARQPLGGSGALVGLQFAPGQEAAIGEMSRLVLAGRPVVRVARERAGATRARR